MTSTLERYFKDMKTENVKAHLDFLEEQMNEANDQWKLQCSYYKTKGWNNLPEWEQETAEVNCEKRRQFWFMQKEITYKNWTDFSMLLDKTDFWKEWSAIQVENRKQFK